MITAKELRELEKHAEECGVTAQELMENAGRETANQIEKKFSDSLKSKKVLVICGYGNNGGDGLVTARYLYDVCTVEVLCIGEKEQLSAESRLNYDLLHDIDSTCIMHYSPENAPLLDLSKYDIVVDVMLGTGVKGEMFHPYSTLANAINDAEVYVVSVDVPSGVNPDAEKLPHKYVRPDMVVTLHDTKKALTHFENVIIVDIGIPF